jgi:hypothetical protein
MITAEELIDRVFDAADFESGVHLEANWIAGVVILADVLLRKDEFQREKLLRGLDRELRDACTGITQILHRGHPQIADWGK